MRSVEDWLAACEGLRREGSEWVGPCPICGGEDRFHVKAGTRGANALAYCRNCKANYGQEEMFKRLKRAAFGGTGGKGSGGPRTEADRIDYARRIWEAARPFGDLLEDDHPAGKWARWKIKADHGYRFPVEVRWLDGDDEVRPRGRSLRPGAGSLVFAFKRPGETHVTGVELLHVGPDGRPVADGGEDPMEKRTYGVRQGAVAVLGEPALDVVSGTLTVVEGLADGLAVAARSGYPVVITGGTSGLKTAVLEQLAVDHGWEALDIWPDGDDPKSSRLAVKVAKRLNGRHKITATVRDIPQGEDPASLARARGTWKGGAPPLATEAEQPSPDGADPDGDDPSDCTYHAIARRFLSKWADRILVVQTAAGEHGWHGKNTPGYGELTAYSLEDRGTWSDENTQWRKWLLTVLDEMAARATELNPRAQRKALKEIHRLRQNRHAVVDIRLSLAVLVDKARDENAPPQAYPDVMVCRVTRLDADLDVIGCRNGVIDLREGQLLSPHEGRERFITRYTDVDFKPDAEHPAVDRLLAHLKKEEQRYWWQVLGLALLGRSGKRMYLVRGPPNGGKTTMAEALVGALGRNVYAGEAKDSALAPSGDLGSHSTELQAFANPRRVVVMDEVTSPRGKLDVATVKRLTGQGSFVYRRLREEPRTAKASATLFLICNPQSVPNLRLEDPAMQDRLRVLEFPAVPEDERDPEFIEVIRTRAFREALLARLVEVASTLQPGRPPDDVPTVAAFTKALVEEDVGEFGAFAARLKPVAGVNTSFKSIWEALCKEQGGDPQDTRVGLVTRRTLTRKLRQHLPELPLPKQVWVDGKNCRGWKDWVLTEAPLPAEEAEKLKAETRSLKQDNERLAEQLERLIRELKEKWAWTSEEVDDYRARRLVPCWLWERDDYGRVKYFLEDGREIKRSRQDSEAGRYWHVLATDEEVSAEGENPYSRVVDVRPEYKSAKRQAGIFHDRLLGGRVAPPWRGWMDRWLLQFDESTAGESVRQFDARFEPRDESDQVARRYDPARLQEHVLKTELGRARNSSEQRALQILGKLAERMRLDPDEPEHNPVVVHIRVVPQRAPTPTAN